MEVDFDLHCGKKILDNRHEADIRKQDVSQSLQTPTFRNWLCRQQNINFILANYQSGNALWRLQCNMIDYDISTI